jgi:hypothetical protein
MSTVGIMPSSQNLSLSYREKEDEKGISGPCWENLLKI